MPSTSPHIGTRTRTDLPKDTGAPSGTSRVPDLAGRAILLATDGSPGAIAGARIARQLARKYHATIHVVSVVDTRPTPIPPPLDMALAMGDALAGPDIHAEQARSVRNDLSGVTGEQIEWPIRIRLGTPANAIVKEAEHIGAVLIIVGLRRHGRLDRARNDETALNVVRHASLPVLGVVEGQDELPTRVLAAVDFTQGSLTAIHTGLSMVDTNALLTLAYVQPLNGCLLDEGGAAIHELGVQAGFAKVATALAHDGVRFDHVVLHHGPPQSIAQAVLEYADDMRCDLLTAGSVQASRIDRWMVGSVSTELVRDGRHSVLIVPPPRHRVSES